MLTYLFFLLGFPVLIKGADFLVEGATSLARGFRVSDLVIGLTVVAFGTSAPELVVNLMASFYGTSDLAVGNVLGSNTANILLVLGTSALLSSLPVSRGVVFRELPLASVVALVFLFLANDFFYTEITVPFVDQIDAVILLAIFAFFLWMSFRFSSKNEGGSGEEDEPEEKNLAKSTALGFCLLGLLMLAFGGNWIVEGAVKMAASLGMSEALIGLTVVAIGTSLPELATSVVAARRGKAAMAIGNALGSNIFNLLWVLGSCALVNPIPYNRAMNIDVWVSFSATALLFPLLFLGRRFFIGRTQGTLMLVFYVAYLGFLVVRG